MGVIYNVTIHIADQKEEEFLEWMRNEHIQEVLDTGLFEKALFLKLLTEIGEQNGVTYAVQYYSPSMEKLQEYYDQHAPQLREKGLAKFGENMLGFRTELELIETFKPKS